MLNKSTQWILGGVLALVPLAFCVASSVSVSVSNKTDQTIVSNNADFPSVASGAVKLSKVNFDRKLTFQYQADNERPRVSYCTYDFFLKDGALTVRSDPIQPDRIKCDSKVKGRTAFLIITTIG